MSSWLIGFLAQMMYSSPILIVVIVAMILALVRWRRHPRASLFFLIALGIFLVLNTVGTLFLFWLPDYLRDGQGAPTAQMLLWIPILHVVRNLIGAAGWVLVAVAVFCDRSAPMADASNL